MPASRSIAPRIRSASSRTSRSGSGSKALMLARLVEKALEDDGGGGRIEVARIAARFPQHRFRLDRAQRLVHEEDGRGEARGKAARELRRERRDAVRRSVGMPGASDHEGGGLPFVDDFRDRGESRL